MAAHCSGCVFTVCVCYILHLHLVIWQTLLSKATYNWGIHKAIHLECSLLCVCNLDGINAEHKLVPYSAVCHVTFTLSQCYSPIEKKQSNLSVRSQASPLLEFSPALESWSDIYTGPTSCLIVTPWLHRRAARQNTIELIIISDAVYTGCRDTTNPRQ